MKKLFIFSFFVLSSFAATSCTTDPIVDQNATEINADDTGGQTGGLTPPPPPKP